MMGLPRQARGKSQQQASVSTRVHLKLVGFGLFALAKKGFSMEVTQNG